MTNLRQLTRRGHYDGDMRVMALALAAAGMSLAAIPEPIHTEAGLVTGVAGGAPEVRVFKGIPYAAPPLGDLRWRAPEPATKWSGVRAADKFAAACMQTPYPMGSPYRVLDEEKTSEDCLYLNIWTAAQSAKERRPVMFWIHGGGLTRGSGSTAAYDGTRFATHGVVVVTVNYRLGVFGYLAHPELTRESAHKSSGNYGFLDQLAALEWVRRNIAAFGGDAAQITIAGESAGSWSVNALEASPLAKGMFARAIGESGALFSKLPTLEEAEKTGVRFAQSVGAANLTELRATPAAELLAKDGTASATVGGWFLPAQVAAIFGAGKQNDAPALIGWNANEGSVFVPAQVNPENFKALARFRFGKDAEEYLKLYPAATAEEAHASSLAAFRDEVFGWEMRTWARLQTESGKAPAYLYYFSKKPPGPFGERMGSFHASEIQYVFGTLGPAATDEDRKLSAQMGDYWTNFIASGNPNGMGLPDWPKYDAKTDEAMNLGDRLGPIPVPDRAALDFLDRHPR